MSGSELYEPSWLAPLETVPIASASASEHDPAAGAPSVDPEHATGSIDDAGASQTRTDVLDPSNPQRDAGAKLCVYCPCLRRRDADPLTPRST